MNRFRAVRRGTMYGSNSTKDPFPNVGLGTILIAPFIFMFAIMAWHITIPTLLIAWIVVKIVGKEKFKR